jgi:sugar phosphate isomerase/epimerase
MTISRRRFLGAAGAVVAAASCRTGAAAPRKVVVGAHPWVYAAKLPGYDITPALDQIFADMSYAGMDGIELMHTALRGADALERIERLVAKHRLGVIGASFGGAMWDRRKHKEVLDDAELVIPRLARLGGRTLGTSVGSTPKPKTPDQLDAQAELVRRLMEICQANKVVLNLHNHTYEVRDDLHDLRGTLARVPGVKLGPDINWLVRGGVDPVDFIRRYGDRIVFLHLRDQKADGTRSEALGEGQMDYAAIARALHEIHFSGDAVIELAHERNFKPTRPLRESLKQSRDYVRRVLGW